MTSMFTTTLQLEIPAHGDFSSTGWDNPMDNTLRALDIAYGQYYTISLTGGQHTLTTTEASYPIIAITGTLSSDQYLDFPAFALAGRRAIIPALNCNGHTLYVRQSNNYSGPNISFTTGNSDIYGVTITPYGVYWEPRHIGGAPIIDGQVTVNAPVNCTQIQAGTAVISTGTGGTYQIYASGTNLIKQYVANWYDSFNQSGGLRNWVGYAGSAQVSLMNLDGSGNLNVRGNVNAGGTLSAAASGSSFAGSVTVGNNLTASTLSANAQVFIGGTQGIEYVGLSSHSIAWGWSGSGLFAYVDGSNQNYVPFGYTPSGATQGILSWGYNTNGNVYASTTGSGQRSWPTYASDRRLKSNIVKSTCDALKAINALNVVSCDMKFDDVDGAESHHWDCALIADEIAPVIPMAYIAPVTYKEREDAEEKTSLAYVRELPLIATLVKAVQQLTEQVESLQARLATLENRR